MKKSIIAALAVSIGLAGGAMVAPTTASAHHSKTTAILHSFPKNMRHTWYHYDGKGRYDSFHFSTNRIKVVQYFGSKASKQTSNCYLYLVKGDQGTWINSKAHGEHGMGLFFKVTKHKGHVALREGSTNGNGIQTVHYFYKTHVK